MSLSESYLSELMCEIHKIINEKTLNPLNAYYQIKKLFNSYDECPFDINYIIDSVENEKQADKDKLQKDDTVFLKNDKDSYIGELKTISGNEIKLKNVFKVIGYRSKTLEINDFNEFKCLRVPELNEKMEGNNV